MAQIAYILQRKPKASRTFVELEKSTDRFYLIREDAEKERVADPILRDFFQVYEVCVDFTEEQITELRRAADKL